MIYRDATLSDVAQMSAFLKELTTAGKRTSPDDEDFVQKYYIEDPAKIRCTVAEENDQILGFQSLKQAVSGNAWGVEPGWGIIGTHIRPSAARRGLGRALFAKSQAAAAEFGLTKIDATIAATNPEALAYYEAMGFKTYRTPEGIIGKEFDLTA